MSAERSYTEEVKHFSNIVEKLTDELGSFRSEIKLSLKEIKDEVSSLKTDADNLTEGNVRHGIRPVREEIKDLKKKIDDNYNTLAKAQKENRESIITQNVQSSALGAGSGGIMYIIARIIEAIA